MNERPDLLAHTQYGEPLTRSFDVEATADTGGSMAADTHGDGSVHYHTGTLAGAEFVDLSNVRAIRGMRWTIVRPTGSTGLGTLTPRTEAPVSLIALAEGGWAEVAFDGSTWVLIATGTGV